MNVRFLLRLLGSLISAGIVLIVGFGSFWLLGEVKWQLPASRHRWGLDTQRFGHHTRLDWAGPLHDSEQVLS